MATIGKIRKRTGLLIAMLGVAMLAFILTDGINSFMGTGITDVTVGEVYGNPITGQTYQQMLDRKTESYKNIYGASNMEAINQRVKYEVWNDLTQGQVMGSELEAVGIRVSQAELSHLVLQEPHQIIKQQFSNPQAGQQFNIEDVRRTVQSLQTGDVNDQRIYQGRMQWAEIEKSVQKARAEEKFYLMTKRGMYATQLEAEEYYKSREKRVNFNYVAAQYALPNDSSVNPTDADYKAYYQEHKNDKQYRQRETREIEYASLNIEPSAQDEQRLMELMGKLKTEFASADNDTVFVKRNSEIKTYQLTEYSRGKSVALSAEVDSLLATSDSGTVVGPYVENGLVKLTKVQGATPEVKVRHILASINDSTSVEQAQAKIDSMETLARAGRNFAQLAIDNSDDPSAAREEGTPGYGGLFDWFKHDAGFVPEFKNSSLKANKGDLITVRSQFGFHLIKIEDKRMVDSTRLLTTVQKTLKPSRETKQNLFNQLNELVLKTQKGEDFEEAAKALALPMQTSVLVQTNNANIIGIGQAARVARWAFEQEVGTVSGVLEANDKLVVAHLTGANEEGAPSFEAFKAMAMVEKKVKNHVQAKTLMAKMQGATLEEVASSAGSTVGIHDQATFDNTSVRGAGNEPAVIGQVFSGTLTEGSLSAPIAGENAVFVVEVKAVTEAPEKADLQQEKTVLTNGFSSSQYQLRSALTNKADVKDYRVKYGFN